MSLRSLNLFQNTQHASWAILGPPWFVSGPSWGCLGLSWGHLRAVSVLSWPIFSRHPPCLLGVLKLGSSSGPSWAILVPPWLVSGPFLGALGPFWGNLGLSWPVLGRSWGCLGGNLGQYFKLPSMPLGCLETWPVVGPILARLGPILDHLDPFWGHLGLSLTRLGVVLRLSWLISSRHATCLLRVLKLGSSSAPSWAILGPPWLVLGPSRDPLGQFWGHLVLSGLVFGPSWGCPEAVLAHLIQDTQHASRFS